MQHIFYYLILIIQIFITYHSAFSWAISGDIMFRGTYNHTYWGFDVYQATLFMDKKCQYPSCDFILQLNYKRAFDGKDIVERSIDEIDNQHNLNTQTQNTYGIILGKVFPDVQQNDVIQGKMVDGFGVFYLNNQFIGRIDDARLSQYFFDIWLSPKTSEPDMRDALLGN
jgi:hypothetical protein